MDYHPEKINNYLSCTQRIAMSVGKETEKKTDKKK
jgi:hypothetical protein